MTNNGKSGKRSLFHSFADAFRGIWDCIKAERNMRIHLSVACYVFFFGVRMGLSRGELACLGVTVGVVMSAEAMNTAVEKLCDFAETRRNPHIRVIKDIAAGAVLLTALAAVAVGLFTFLRPALWEAVLEICHTPALLVPFLLFAILDLVFIFAGPLRMAGWFSEKKKR